MRPLSALPAYLRTLLEVLQTPARCAALDAGGWDLLLRAAHASKLLGVLAARLRSVVAIETLDPVVQRALQAATVEARFRRHKTHYLLATIAPVIVATGEPCVLLKGAGYIVQRLAFADGRLPSDVDIMVPHAVLAHVERALLDAGWQFDDDLSDYDKRYYRDWTHEVPPLRAAGQSLELDLHHAILPPLGRLKPDTAALFASSTPVEGTPYRLLAPADQVLLAAAHLFHDSDCTDHLRDLVDLDGLMRAFAAQDAAFWSTLAARAQLHQLGRPLWYAVMFARTWLGTPVPDSALDALRAFRPGALSGALFTRMVESTLPPVDPDGEASFLRHRATQLLLARATWLRFPPGLVVQHTLHKLRDGMKKPPAPEAGPVAG